MTRPRRRAMRVPHSRSPTVPHRRIAGIHNDVGRDAQHDVRIGDRLVGWGRLSPVIEAATPFRRAVTTGLAVPLADYGFSLNECEEGHRGAEALIANDHLIIRVTLDRLEGEMTVTVGLLGLAEIPLDRVVDLARVKGLKLRRIPRAARSGFIEAQLKRVAEALTSQVPTVLADYEAASRIMTD